MAPHALKTRYYLVIPSIPTPLTLLVAAVIMKCFFWVSIHGRRMYTPKSGHHKERARDGARGGSWWMRHQTSRSLATPTPMQRNWKIELNFNNVQGQGINRARWADDWIGAARFSSSPSRALLPPPSSNRGNKWRRLYLWSLGHGSIQCLTSR
jgi:hypothetical protein